MTPQAHPLTVVMYHYVRDVAGTAFAQLPVRSPAEFSRQLDEISRRYTVVGLDHVAAAIRGERALPPDALLLTFDDGYRDHYATVLPELHRRGWSGVFFPVASVLEHPQVLNVNKIQFARARLNPEQAFAQVCDWITEHQQEFNLQPLSNYLERWAVAARFDGSHAMFVKNVLQRALSRPARQTLIDELFRTHVAEDEAAFARELYMNREEIAGLVRAGMFVGLHGYAHDWLTDLTPTDLDRDLREALRVLSDCGVPERGWCFCYPFGGINDAVCGAVGTLGASIGFTTEPRVALLGTDHPLRLPRLDTNDLPC